MIEYEIVELTIDELPKCASFWGHPNTRLEEFLKNGTRRVFACKADGEFVGGCALMVREDERGHFSDFFVRENLRGRGIGSRIIEFALGFFKNEGVKTVRLHVYKDNLSAARLYTRYGFEYLEDVTPEKIAMIKNILKKPSLI